MKHTYTVTGMTCQGCVASVTEKLYSVGNVKEVEVDLEKKEATISMEKHVPLQKLQSALSEKYTISEKGNHVMEMSPSEEKSKWVQLRPLFLIFAYLFVAAFLLNFKDRSVSGGMLDFMGLFYIVFSFFKLLDLRGFPASFGMYDPLARLVPAYGWVYPFIELGLGLLFLMRVQIQFALIATIVILGITTFGVTKTLMDKKSIRCACLGTTLKLPMTEATFIENAIMLIMALWMLMV
ncbi:MULTISPECIES: heavy-metal-associated domain-containing protein [Flavobacteriaceae]|uniref:heavy metal translocating P-type ATPase n=1 Tax=Flavobacteriaceae TaxID=49546 RepID=UPI0014918696|nr:MULTISPECIES: heavy-metal-associated domain-containing protein [Allomuricauda]MDC6365599.1 heavy-metal-associated domain-containing protein [Muricauda sp. AC10]